MAFYGWLAGLSRLKCTSTTSRPHGWLRLTIYTAA